MAKYNLSAKDTNKVAALYKDNPEFFNRFIQGSPMPQYEREYITTLKKYDLTPLKFQMVAGDYMKWEQESNLAPKNMSFLGVDFGRQRIGEEARWGEFFAKNTQGSIQNAPPRSASLPASSSTPAGILSRRDIDPVYGSATAAQTTPVLPAQSSTNAPYDLNRLNKILPDSGPDIVTSSAPRTREEYQAQTQRMIDLGNKSRAELGLPPMTQEEIGKLYNQNNLGGQMGPYGFAQGSATQQASPEPTSFLARRNIDVNEPMQQPASLLARRSMDVSQPAQQAEPMSFLSRRDMDAAYPSTIPAGVASQTPASTVGRAVTSSDQYQSRLNTMIGAAGAGNVTFGSTTPTSASTPITAPAKDVAAAAGVGVGAGLGGAVGSATQTERKEIDLNTGYSMGLIPVVGKNSPQANFTRLGSGGTIEWYTPEEAERTQTSPVISGPATPASLALSKRYNQMINEETAAGRSIPVGRDQVNMTARGMAAQIESEGIPNTVQTGEIQQMMWDPRQGKYVQDPRGFMQGLSYAAGFNVGAGSPEVNRQQYEQNLLNMQRAQDAAYGLSTAGRAEARKDREAARDALIQGARVGGSQGRKDAQTQPKEDTLKPMELTPEQKRTQSSYLRSFNDVATSQVASLQATIDPKNPAYGSLTEKQKTDTQNTINIFKSQDYKDFVSDVSSLLASDDLERQKFTDAISKADTPQKKAELLLEMFGQWKLKNTPPGF